MFPQSHCKWRAKQAAPVNSVNEFHEESGDSEVLLNFKELSRRRFKLARRLYHSIKAKDWSLWKSTLSEYRKQRIPYDEEAYTLMLHGYLLSHRHRSENAMLVLEEMRKAEIHPALLRMNERFVKTYFELLEENARPSAEGWERYVAIAWFAARRLAKKRTRSIRDQLRLLPPNEVLKLTESDIRNWIGDMHLQDKIYLESTTQVAIDSAVDPGALSAPSRESLPANVEEDANLRFPRPEPASLQLTTFDK